MAVSNNRPPRRDSDVEVDDGVPPSRRISPILIGMIVTVLVLLALIFVVGRHGSDSSADDRLPDNGLAAAPDGSPEALCASRSTYDLIKTALFRQAAQVRGRDQAAYEQLAHSAFLRMEAPALTGQDKSRGAVACSGSLTLELPPGLAVTGGSRTLSGEIDYVVEPAADGSGSGVALSQADGMITQLATLARTASVAPLAPKPASPQQADPLAPAPNDFPPADQPAATTDQPAQPAASPSFNCANARSRSEIAVCTDVGLAALDRQMASQFNRATGQADSQQQALLRQTRDSFLRYRDRCASNSCIASSYQGRIREIRDIMNGDWQPPR